MNTQQPISKSMGQNNINDTSNSFGQDLQARMILGVSTGRDGRSALDGLPSRIPALGVSRTGYIGKRPGKEEGDSTMNSAYRGAEITDKNPDDILAGLAAARKVVLWAGQGVIASREVAAHASHSVRAWVDYAGASDQSDAYSNGVEDGPHLESIVGMDEARRVLSFIAMGVAPSQENTRAAAWHIERSIESMTAMLDTEKPSFESAPRQRS